MDFEYIIKHYNVPAAIGRRVVVDGETGIIVADRGQYIGVNFDKDKPGVIKNCHPTWRVEYHEMGKVRKLTRAQQRYRDYLEVSECYDDFMHYVYCKAYDRKLKNGHFG